MLRRRRGNHQIAVVDLVIGGKDIRQRLLRQFGQANGLLGHGAAVEHGVDGAGGVGLDAANHLFDFLGRLRGAMGEGAYFVGDHGKTTARITGPRRFDGRVQCQ